MISLLFMILLSLSLFGNQIINTNSDYVLTDTDLLLSSNLSNSDTKLIPLLSNFNQNLTRILSEMYIDVLENGEDTFIENHFTYYNSGEEDVYFIIHVIDIITILAESRISSIIVYDAFGALSYKWDIQSSLHLINITLREALQPLSFVSFSISYALENAVISNPDITQNFILQWTLTFDEDIEQFSIITTIPSAFELVNQSAVDPFPDYKSADGRRLEWSLNNVLEDQSETWIIRFQMVEHTTIPENGFKPGFWSGLIVTFILGLLIGSLGMYFILKTRTDSERKVIVESLLSQPEKEILKIVKDEGGTTTQNKIVDLSGFSKAKVSYYVTELEKKKIISRERWGRMNRIKIIDDSVDKVFIADHEETNTET
ncbi:MAG: winged helix-turn-helix transcriptional regulator [Asgard group archaeon]|nr:winged helix-turn-helix transcriptional regulator [Asgard group archaeon]